jgi:hypothetical protein
MPFRVIARGQPANHASDCQRHFLGTRLLRASFENLSLDCFELDCFEPSTTQSSGSVVTQELEKNCECEPNQDQVIRSSVKISLIRSSGHQVISQNQSHHDMKNKKASVRTAARIHLIIRLKTALSISIYEQRN